MVAPEYKDRATVMMDDHGSTLTIGIAKAEDRGLYKCSVAVRGDQPEIKHQVRIRGESGHTRRVAELIVVDNSSSSINRLVRTWGGGGDCW